MTSRNIMISSFFDGLAAPLLVLRKVKRPGSHSEELEAFTTPDMLAAYGAVDASLPALLLEIKAKERKRDAVYSMCMRINGSIGWLAIVVALCVLATRR